MISKHDSFVSFEHPLLNHLIECKTDEQIVITMMEIDLFLDYHLDQISRFGLCKRLHRRLLHVRQKIEDMSTNEIEIKLKHKRDGLFETSSSSIELELIRSFFSPCHRSSYEETANICSSYDSRRTCCHGRMYELTQQINRSHANLF